MKKKIISLILVGCLLVSFSLTTYAAEPSTSSLESDAAERIEQIIFTHYANSPGQYEVGNVIAIYNADVVCIYYIIPVFRNQECVGIVEMDVNGNVVLSSNTTLYANITELSFSEYLLYTTGGIVHAEHSEGIVELYDSGFSISANNDFALLSYADKAASIALCLETAATNLDADAVVEQVEIPNMVAPGISLCAEVPLTEAERCYITNFVRQTTDYTCWAACVATVTNYITGNNLTDTAVASFMGHNYTSSEYRGARIDQIVAAFSAYGLSYNTNTGKPSWLNTRGYINNSLPFVIIANTPNGLHALTGYGYECRYEDPDMYSSWRYVTVWDPMDEQLSLQYNASSYSTSGYTFSWVATLVP